MLQVQEDGVLTHKVPQQLGHVGDTMWDDGQPLLARHVAPGQALQRGQGRQISWGQARSSSAREDQRPSFRGNKMRGWSWPSVLFPPQNLGPPPPRAVEEAVGMCLGDRGMLREGQVAFGFGGCMSFRYRFWVGSSPEGRGFHEL